MQVQRAVPLLSSVVMAGQNTAATAEPGVRTVSIDVRVGAAALEVRVVGDAGRRAGRRGVVLTAAAVGGVGCRAGVVSTDGAASASFMRTLVAVEVRLARTPAADREAGGVVGALEGRRACVRCHPSAGASSVRQANPQERYHEKT